MQHAGQRLAQLRARHADEFGGRARGVEQRAQQVEDRPLAARGAELARGRDVLEGGMIIRREEKHEAAFRQHLRRFGGRQMDIDAQRLDHIAAADLGRDRAVAVLGDCHSCRRTEDGHGGGDVERAELVAARPDHVENFPGAGGFIQRQRDGLFPHRAGERGDFLNRLAFASQRREKIRFGLGGDLFRDELLHGGSGLHGRQGFAAAELLGEGSQHERNLKSNH